MGRTKESAGSQGVIGAKAPRKAVFSTSPGVKKPSKGKKKFFGFYNPRPTSLWKKKITGFLKKGVNSTETSTERDNGPSGSQSQPHEKTCEAGQANVPVIIDLVSSSSDSEN